MVEDDRVVQTSVIVTILHILSSVQLLKRKAYLSQPGLLKRRGSYCFPLSRKQDKKPVSVHIGIRPSAISTEILMQHQVIPMGS